MNTRLLDIKIGPFRLENETLSCQMQMRLFGLKVTLLRMNMAFFGMRIKIFSILLVAEHSRDPEGERQV